MIEVMKSKLHCVTVTEANLNYMGSITIDEDLMEQTQRRKLQDHLLRCRNSIWQNITLSHV